jgi:hypothetical protein
MPVERDAEVFALFPHMHRAGVSLHLARDDGACVLDVPAWRYGAQELVRPAAPIRVGAREPLALSCAWDVSDRESDTRFGEARTTRCAPCSCSSPCRSRPTGAW